jgi:hypothetical protein
MFEYAHGDNAVECPAYIAIVLEFDFNRAPLAYFPAQVRLFPGNGDSGRRDSIFFRSVFHEAAIAAADIQDRHPCMQSQLSAEQIELGFLRRVQVCGSQPVTARVGHGFTKHHFEQIIADKKRGELL